jgi:ribosomal protein S18 acetylase RimI-like enzyme
VTATIALRPPVAADRARVRWLVESAGVFQLDEVPVALEVFDDAVASPGSDYRPIGAYDDEALVGYAIFGPVPCTLTTWDLYWIVVAPALQQRGLGRQLMAHCERAIRTEGGHLLVAETSSRQDYRPARDFYERLGFTRQAVIPEYYAPRDDLIVFTKDLRASDGETAHG